MKSSRVYIKANYIKKAKNDWIYCDAQILKQNNISMLKLSSINPLNDERDDTVSRISNFSNISTIYRSKLSQSIALKVLCNLSEFKSSEIKPVNFYNTEKFAIKLVPTGLLNSKKLFFIPENEEELTKWCTILGEHINKSKDVEIKQLKNIELSERDSNTLRKHNSLKDTYASIKSKKELEKELLEAEKIVSELNKKQVEIEKNKYNDEICSMTPNSPMSYDGHKSEEIYFAMDDNDVYESTGLENSYTVCVEESSDSKKIGIRGCYLMKLKTEGIELCEIKKGETIHEFPYIFIRRFGAKNDLLRIEAGRKCTTGEGYFIFRFKDAAKAVTIIKELVKELKKNCVKSPDTDQEDSTSNRNSLSMSVNSSTFECNVDTSTNKTSRSNVSQDNTANIIHNSERSTVKSMTPLSVKTVTINSPSSQSSSSPQSPQSPQSPHSPIPNTKKHLHPLYNSVSSVTNGRSSPTMVSTNNPLTLQTPRSSSATRLPVVNNAFNRNQYASSFSYRRPTQTNIPITKVQDDSCTRSAIYDNIPVYEQKPDIFNCQPTSCSPYRTGQAPTSNLKFTSSYTMKGSLANTTNGQYDNVPNNQRCIKELETMLMDLGIPTN